MNVCKLTDSSIRSLSELVEKGTLSKGEGSSILYPAFLNSSSRLRPNNYNDKYPIIIQGKWIIYIQSKHNKYNQYSLHFHSQTM